VKSKENFTPTSAAYAAAEEFIDVICISNIYTIFYSSQLDSHFRSLFQIQFILFLLYFEKDGSEVGQGKGDS
jgi:hypothetical protein